MHGNGRELIRPKSIVADQETLSVTYGKFVCEPLERGFGLTLGNALRRVLLSSIRGAAVTQIRIEGVLHEFSTLPDVVEDVTQIVLNLKGLDLRMNVDGPHTIHARLEGEREVVAGDIFTGGEVETTNPSHHIATLGPDGILDMELEVKSGYGYKSAERNKDPNAPLGTIVIDAIFTPIRKVNYRVAPARVGQHTDYDKLTIEVWTSGAVLPKEAISIAAKVMRDQLSIFTGLADVADLAEEDTPVAAPVTEVPAGAITGGIGWDVLYRPIEELDLSVRAQNCLQNAGLRFVGELVQKTEQEMLRTRNFGRKSLKEIRDVLSDLGLSLGMQIDGFDPGKRSL